MRKASFAKNHEEFEFWLNIYEGCLQEVAENTSELLKSRFIKSEFVEALTLRIAVRWERLVEDDIVASLNRNASAYGAALGLRLRKHLSRDECIAMLIGQRYLDFRSVAEVKDFGKRFLSSKLNPFAGISAGHAKKIDQLFRIRNFLSHYSAYAQRSYRGMMRQDFKFTRIPEPGAFLLAKTKANKYRWEEFFTALRETSAEMLAAVP